MEFLDVLMQTVIKSKDIPKAQVERYVSPILEIFIASALSKILDKKIELIMPEFPIKKEENNQSTNIDYLLTSEDEIIFLELKTDTTSSNDGQMKVYEKLRSRDSLGEDLHNDFEEIKNNSSKKKKYETHQALIKDKLNNLKKLHKLKIVYLIPKQLKESIKFNTENKTVITFEDLYNHRDIEHDFSSEWGKITTYLKALDSN